MRLKSLRAGKTLSQGSSMTPGIPSPLDPLIRDVLEILGDLHGEAPPNGARLDGHKANVRFIPPHTIDIVVPVPVMLEDAGPLLEELFARLESRGHYVVGGAVWPGESSHEEGSVIQVVVAVAPGWAVSVEVHGPGVEKPRYPYSLDAYMRHAGKG